MTKVRYKTWYWGNYCLAPDKMDLPNGFELYNEKEHGWKNSDEFKIYGTEQYTTNKENDVNINVYLKEIF